MAFAIKVNGNTHNVDVDGDTPLLWVLRDVLGMTGTKFGCGMALCGACTVHIDGAPTRSCITTIEAIGARSPSSLPSVPQKGDAPVRPEKNSAHAVALKWYLRTFQRARCWALAARLTPASALFSSVGLGVSAAEGPAIFRPENSQMMIASAISPTRPASPSDLTKARMFSTTFPKNGRFAPTRSAATIASANSKSPISVSAPIQFFTVSNMCVSPFKFSEQTAPSNSPPR